jgi:hypothetical protein
VARRVVATPQFRSDWEQASGDTGVASAQAGAAIGSGLLAKTDGGLAERRTDPGLDCAPHLAAERPGFLVLAAHWWGRSVLATHSSPLRSATGSDIVAGVAS